jgi:hypothetical protein
VLLDVEAVLEFQVLTNAYSAEFGRSAGGVINAVTRSGANAVHGSGFEFYRNSALDAKNFFDPADKPIPDFYRHQFGGVAGGPLVKDRTFYFAAFESLIERFGVTGVTAVPDDNARLGILPSGPVTLHPAIPTYLETLFPAPTDGRSAAGRRSTCSRRRSRQTSTSGRFGSITGSKAATACSGATRSTMGRSTGCRPPKSRCRSQRSTRAISTWPSSISTCSPPRC